MPTLAVVNVLMGLGPDDHAWGFRICDETGLGSGSVYPILERLEDTGWVRSYWEDSQPSGRPRRRFYEMTGHGRSEAIAAIAARNSKRPRRLRPVMNNWTIL